MRIEKLITPLLLIVCSLMVTSAKMRKQARLQQPCEKLATQADASECAYKDYQAADSELNRMYSQLTAKIDVTERARLKEAELAWLKYRDANCEYESGFYMGGTMRPMIESFCRARMTRARTAEIREQIKFQQEQ